MSEFSETSEDIKKMSFLSLFVRCSILPILMEKFLWNFLTFYLNSSTFWARFHRRQSDLKKFQKKKTNDFRMIQKI